MTAKALSLLAAGAVLLGSPCGAETHEGLELDFKRRAVELRVSIDDLEDAYRVDADGAIRMLAHPTIRNLEDRHLTLEIAPGKRGTGVLRLRGDGPEVVVASDNALRGPSRIGGLPFGYAFLPPGGKAAEGQLWEESFPAPEGSGARVAATFRYTLVGAAPSDDCPDCVEIRIVGLRRFVPSSSLVSLVAGVLAKGEDEFFTSDQVFAVGGVLFSPAAGFPHRFELAMNTSLLTPLAVPGMMRRVVAERVEVAP